jgi:hypothetical protein
VTIKKVQSKKNSEALAKLFYMYEASTSYKLFANNN